MPHNGAADWGRSARVVEIRLRSLDSKWSQWCAYAGPEEIESASEVRSGVVQVVMAERLSLHVLNRPVHGPGVSERSLGEVLAGGPSLLVFLRHFG